MKKNKLSFNLFCLTATVIALSSMTTVAEAAPTYQQHIRPIFQRNCVKCHSTDKREGDLDLSSYAGVLAGGASGPVVRAGRVQSSLLYQSMAHFENVEPMPPEADRISPKKLMLVAEWIKRGLLEKPFSPADD